MSRKQVFYFYEGETEKKLLEFLKNTNFTETLSICNIIGVNHEKQFIIFINSSLYLAKTTLPKIE
jgi:hypothetical protein